MANPKTQPKPIGPGSSTSDGYTGPSFDLGQLAGNPTAISPDYTSDPAQAASALQTMKNELAYAQANPNDPNSSYIISTLTPAITEQQNIATYDQAQVGQNDASTALSGLQVALNGQTPTDVQQAAIKNITGQTTSDILNEANQMASAYKGRSDYNDILKNITNALVQVQMTNVQNQISNGQLALGKDQSAISSGLTYAQPNYAGLSSQITNTFGGPNGGNPTGLYGSTLTPQLQDIYSVAYNNKMGTTAQLQGMGLGSSGAMNQAKQTQDTNALNKSLSALSNFNNTEAGLQTGLKNQQQQQQAQYQTEIQQAQGNILGGNLAGAAGNLGQASNNNITAQTQTALNNAATQLGNQQMQDTTMNNLFNNMGSLAGTWAGNTNWFGGTQPAPGTV